MVVLFEWMLVEIDVFYLVFVFYCGKWNELGYIWYVVEKIVELW